MIERERQRVALARSEAEVAFVFRQRCEAQRRAVLFDLRQQNFEEVAACELGLLYRKGGTPARVQRQRLAAEITADCGQMDEVSNSVVAMLLVFE